MSDNNQIPLDRARNYMALIWFPGSFIPFIILVTQSILGKYGDSVQKVWAWFVPAVGPTLALILGVMGALALTTNQDNKSVKVFFFKLSVGLSIAYLLVLTFTILLEPFSPLRGIDLYTMANFYLAPIQSLSVAAITVLFTSQEKTKP
jgi:hypothetical protein